MSLVSNMLTDAYILRYIAIHHPVEFIMAKKQILDLPISIMGIIIQ